MRITWRAVASLFMSIIFLMGMSTSGINSKWVAHELDQHFYAPGASVATDAPELVATDSSSSKTSGDIENQLLHAVSHVQPLLVSSIFDGFSKSAPHVFIKLPQLFDVPTTDIAPPFRPPRISFPI